MELTHNRAVDFQLQQLWHAMGLALALNRTLLMPRMLCFCVRGWFANDACRLPGDKVSMLPFNCTGDQVGGGMQTRVAAPTTSSSHNGARVRTRAGL